MSKRRNIQTPLGEIQERLKTVERHPNAAVEMYIWLRENIQRLKDEQSHIEDMREAQHQREMDSILLSEKVQQNP
jgi:predicted nuclease with TOPRIM domain